MKLAIYRIVKNKVWRRFSTIKQKQQKRLNAVIEARKEINKWDDIPLSWQQGSISTILRYPNGMRASKEFMTALTLTTTAYSNEILAKAIPLNWYEN